MNEWWDFIYTRMLSSKLVGIYPKTENRDNFPTIIKQACDDDERARTKILLSGK